MTVQTGRAPTEIELAFVQQRRVGHLATVDGEGRPANVPVCFAVVSGNGVPAVVSALDEKPKQVPVTQLARVRHILANPAVSLVVDDYDEDWSRLAFVHLRGRAQLVDPGSFGHAEAIAALRLKYAQYTRMAIDERPIIRIDDLSATSWRGDRGERVDDVKRPQDLAALIRGRRSVRAFQDRPVSEDLIRQAIAAAGWAPSPHGRQPWRFVVLTADDRKAALADAMAATWRAQLELDGQDATIVQTRLDKSQARVRQAPVVIIPCLFLDDLDHYPDADRQAAETTMAIQSLGAAIQNLLLTIYVAGLDAGWMCAPLFCPDIVRDILNLSVSLTPHALLTIGYAAKDPVRRDRLTLDQLIVSWE